MRTAEHLKMILELRLRANEGWSASRIAHWLLDDLGVRHFDIYPAVGEAFGMYLGEAREFEILLARSDRSVREEYVGLNTTWGPYLSDQGVWPDVIFETDIYQGEPHEAVFRLFDITQCLSDAKAAIDWGDGTTETKPIQEIPVSHVYKAAGTYLFRCTFTGSTPFLLTDKLTFADRDQRSRHTWVRRCRLRSTTGLYRHQ